MKRQLQNEQRIQKKQSIHGCQNEQTDVIELKHAKEPRFEQRIDVCGMKTGNLYMVPLFLLLSRDANILHNKAVSETTTFTSSIASSTHASHPLMEEPSRLTHPQARRCLLKKARLKTVESLAKTQIITPIVEQYTSTKKVNASFLEYADSTAAPK